MKGGVRRNIIGGVAFLAGVRHLRDRRSEVVEQLVGVQGKCVVYRARLQKISKATQLADIFRRRGAYISSRLRSDRDQAFFPQLDQSAAHRSLAHAKCGGQLRLRKWLAEGEAPGNNRIANLRRGYPCQGHLYVTSLHPTTGRPRVDDTAAPTREP